MKGNLIVDQGRNGIRKNGGGDVVIVDIVYALVNGLFLSVVLNFYL